MLKNKLNLHTTAFLTMLLASIFMFPAAQAGFTLLTRSFLGLAVLSAFITLMAK